jgi:hypothetical protein
MPWVYWEHGLFAVAGGLVVCFVVLLGMASLTLSTEEHNGYQDHLIPWFWGILAWIGAWLLLQALPHTTSGIQFIPLFPWFYDGWVSRMLSFVCWFCMITSCICALSSVKGNWTPAVGQIFIALCLNALLSFSGPSDAPQAANEKPSSIKSCEDKIAQWEKLKTDQSEMLEKFLSDKEMLVSRIRSLGLNKLALMNHRVGRPLVDELEQLTRQIAKCQGEVDALEAVVENANSKMRIFERQRMLRHSTDDEFKQMSEMEHQLDAELRRKAGDVEPGSAVHLNKLLDEVLGSNK